VNAFPITSPGPLLPLDAPLPQPRKYTLLDAASLVTPTDDRWRAGAWINGYPSGPVQTHDPCSTGTFRLKDVQAGTARPMAGAFTVVQGGSCSARSVGSDSGWYTDRLALAFQAVESTGVERVFATGDHHSTLGAYMADGNMDAPYGATAVSRREGLATLEDAIAAVGAGMIHATPGLIDLWQGDYLIETIQGQKRTGAGTIVVSGAGYIGVRPDGYAGGLGASESWAFATGFVQVRRGDLTILPGQYSQALDRVENELTFYAERDYLITWVGRQDNSDDDHIQVGVKIDRST
jgi:hypothetical protein